MMDVPDGRRVVGHPRIIHHRRQMKQIPRMLGWVGKVDSDRLKELLIPNAGNRLLRLRGLDGDTRNGQQEKASGEESESHDQGFHQRRRRPMNTPEAIITSSRLPGSGTGTVEGASRNCPPVS